MYGLENAYYLSNFVHFNTISMFINHNMIMDKHHKKTGHRNEKQSPNHRSSNITFFNRGPAKDDLTMELRVVQAKKQTNRQETELIHEDIS